MGRIIVYGFFVLAMLTGGCTRKNRLPDLRETYGFKDPKPFGAAVAYSLLNHAYLEQGTEVHERKFSDNPIATDDTAALYISISKKLFLDEEDVNGMLNYVYQGNTVMLAAAEIDSTLLTFIGCKVSQTEWLSMMGAMLYRDTHLELVKDIAAPDSSFNYFYLPFSNYFSEINNGNCRIVAYNEQNQPNLLVLFYGKGKLFLHCDPRAFSNYFLLRENNHHYFANILQLMPESPERIYWNDFYAKKNSRGAKDVSALAALFKYPPLKWAFWIALALLLLYILFNGKRMQRIVPVIKPVQNSSIAFAEAIAGLYLKDKDNKIIAEKMINYFNEHIRSRYFLNTSHVNSDFILAVSKRSGIPIEKVTRLYQAIGDSGGKSQVTDDELLQLNQQIQEFYK